MGRPRGQAYELFQKTDMGSGPETVGPHGRRALVVDVLLSGQARRTPVHAPWATPIFTPHPTPRPAWSSFAVKLMLVERQVWVDAVV